MQLRNFASPDWWFYWRGASRQGVYAGLLIGFAVELHLAFSQRCCAACLNIIGLLPNICCCLAHLISTPCVQKLCSALSPLRLDPRGTVVFGVERWFHIWVSRLYRPSVAEQIQAESGFFTMKASLCHPAPVKYH